MKICLENIDALVEENLPFLIHTVSSLTGRYVSVENDDEFSIALNAFALAVEKYDETKGPFLPFVKRVVDNRLKNAYLKASKEPKTTSMEVLEENGYQFKQEEYEDDTDLLREEIKQYRVDLAYFNLTFESLVEEAPKHCDTRSRAMEIASIASEDQNVISTVYKKRKLPIRMIADLCDVSEKIVKHSKNFILATMIIFIRKYPELNRWIRETRCYHDA